MTTWYCIFLYYTLTQKQGDVVSWPMPMRQLSAKDLSNTDDINCRSSNGFRQSEPNTLDSKLWNASVFKQNVKRFNREN